MAAHDHICDYNVSIRVCVIHFHAVFLWYSIKNMQGTITNVHAKLVKFNQFSCFNNHYILILFFSAESIITTSITEWCKIKKSDTRGTKSCSYLLISWCGNSPNNNCLRENKLYMDWWDEKEHMFYRRILMRRRWYVTELLANWLNVPKSAV